MSRLVRVLDRAMRRELDELPPEVVARGRSLVLCAVANELHGLPRLPLLRLVAEVNRAIARAMGSLLASPDAEARDVARSYVALLRNGRDVEAFEAELRDVLRDRSDVLAAYSLESY